MFYVGFVGAANVGYLDGGVPDIPVVLKRLRVGPGLWGWGG